MRAYRETDVLVAGGGPAGIGAALVAARAGAKTLLLERHAFLGGVASHALGMPVNQMRPANIARGAIHEMIIDSVLAYGPEAGNMVDHALVCNVDYLRVAVMDVLESTGVDYLLHTQVVDTLTDGNRVTGAVIATKQGLAEVRAKMVIDTTGDADVTFFAGAETLKGRDGDGFLSPMTLLLMITNVDVEGARAWQRDGGYRKILDEAREKYPLIPQSMGFELGPFPIKNALVINHGGTKAHGSLDASLPEDITEAERYSRGQAIQIVDALREFGGPAFASVQLATTGPQVGVRETRRIKGEYILTEEDALSGARFDDVIAWRSGWLDIGFVRFDKMKIHDVPYRALLPEKVDNLLAAGRCISASHVAASAGKSMGNCMATGHAAGLAAAMAIKRNCAPRALPVADLQAALRADGVDLARGGEDQDWLT